MTATVPTLPDQGSSLLPTRDTRESHPVAFLCQVQPPRHLINHHLDLVFIQGTENVHTQVETLEKTSRTVTRLALSPVSTPSCWQERPFIFRVSLSNRKPSAWPVLSHMSQENVPSLPVSLGRMEGRYWEPASATHYYRAGLPNSALRGAKTPSGEIRKRQ